MSTQLNKLKKAEILKLKGFHKDSSLSAQRLKERLNDKIKELGLKQTSTVKEYKQALKDFEFNNKHLSKLTKPQILKEKNHIPQWHATVVCHIFRLCFYLLCTMLRGSHFFYLMGFLCIYAGLNIKGPPLALKNETPLVG